MDNEKLVIGGVIIIAALIGIPLLYPMLVDTTARNAAKDKQSMERIQAAVDNYAKINQRYPNTMYDLVPEYLAEVPLSTSRLAFQYNPGTGRVALPDYAAASSSRSAGGRGAGGGGVPPATDAITGLSVSEELNF
jgi:hypothetical protein